MNQPVPNACIEPMVSVEAKPVARGETATLRTKPRILIACLVGLLLLLASCSEPQLAGMVRQPTPNVADVTLPDVTNGGREFPTIAQESRLLAVYFGYTQCPDICPTTMADLRSAVEDLGTEGDRIDVAFVTVDPERDTPERLASYIQAFFDDGIALRTEDPARLAKAAASFGTIYEVTKADDGSIDVAHSTLLSVIDSQGNILVQWPFGTTADDMRSDLKILLKRRT